MKTEDKMGALESEHLLTKTRNRMPVPFFSSLYFFSDYAFTIQVLTIKSLNRPRIS